MVHTATNEQSTKQSSILVQVSTDLTVQIIPNPNYDFLMDSKQVALGYGVSYGNIREHKRVNDEFIEGKHFVVGVRISDTEPTNKVFWTKRGVVRLGFFIKSERAKLFRDWAEDFIVNETQRNLLGEPIPVKRLKSKGNHNRLTPDRIIDILHDVCQIEDADLRKRISDKLKGGRYA